MTESTEFPPLTIRLPKSHARLQRCSDALFRQRRQSGIPVECQECVFLGDDAAPLLPRIHAALAMRFGPSGTLFDPVKGAFAFPFELVIQREGRSYDYLMKLVNCRHGVEMDLYRIPPAGEAPRDRIVYHPPWDDELSRQDIRYLAEYLEGFMSGYLETMPCWTAPFLHEVQSDLVLSGFHLECGFFEEHHPNHTSYREALTVWRARFDETGGLKAP